MKNKDNRDVSGVLILDKPPDMTSFDAVAKLRRIYGTRHIGHAGTLDPMATGVLIVLIGSAAKAEEYLSHEKKSYEARLILGQTSDTGDVTGAVRETGAPIPSADEVAAAAKELTGKLLQLPPMYSAIKIGGKKLVDLARKGIEVEREKREITVYSLEIEKIENSETGREYRLRCEVSGGTYIRTLITDLGEKLGCGAVMSALRRTSAVGFDLSLAHRFDELTDKTFEEADRLLLPVERLFEDLQSVILPPFFEKLCRGGCPIYTRKLGEPAKALSPGDRVRLSGENGFFAVAHCAEVPAEKDENATETALIADKKF